MKDTCFGGRPFTGLNTICGCAAGPCQCNNICFGGVEYVCNKNAGPPGCDSVTGYATLLEGNPSSVLSCSNK